MLPFSLYYDPSPQRAQPQQTHMEIKKKKRAGRGCEDELAAVKAAAWAWYQRHEGRPVRGFDTTRSHRVPTPSRYKIEALREISLNNAEIPQGSGDTHGDGSRLLDAQEIKSISKRLDHLKQSPASPCRHELCHRERGRDRDHEHDQSRRMVVSKSKLLKRVLFGHGAVCGRSDDVDTTAFQRSTANPRSRGGRR